MEQRKRSFFERLTGSIGASEEQEKPKKKSMWVAGGDKKEKKNNNWIEEENEEAELAVDLYQTGTEIVIQTMVAGVKPEDLELSIARDTVTIKGSREESRTIDENNFFAK